MRTLYEQCGLRCTPKGLGVDDAAKDAAPRGGYNVALHATPARTVRLEMHTRGAGSEQCGLS